MSVKSNALAATGKRAPAKLSSGILGMKFMQKDDSPPIRDIGESETESNKKQPNKFLHDKDPGAWFGPRSEEIKTAVSRSSKLSKTTAVNYADLYEATPANGRRTFGQKPNTINAEDMVKSPSSLKNTNNNIASRGKKRRSEEGLSERPNSGSKSKSSSRSRTPKKQRKSI